MGKKDEGYLWVGHHDEHGDWIGSRTPLNKARKQAERSRRAREARFRRAPFPLYGLPSSWEGVRRLGGDSYSQKGSHSREHVQSLELVHGSRVEGAGSALGIETALPGCPPGGGELRCIAESFWTGLYATIREAYDEERRHYDPLVEPPPLHVPTRAEMLVSIDGVSIGFDVLSAGTKWVGRARVDGNDVTIEGADYPLQDLELVTITDVEPYIAGGF